MNNKPNKQNKNRKRKRKFCGNQFTARRLTTTTEETAPPPTNNLNITVQPEPSSIQIDSASSRKLTPLHVDKNEEKTDNDYFIFISIDNLIKTLSCPSCTGSNTLKLTNKESARMGFAHKISIFCEDCLWEKDQYTSKNCERISNSEKENKQVQGRRP